MKMKKTVLTSVLAMCLLNITSCGSSTGGGASSEEKAVRNFAEAYTNSDIKGCLKATAPNKFWDYLTDKTGLTEERLFYKVAGFEGDTEYKKVAEDWKTRFKENNLTFKQIEIESGHDMDDKNFSFISFAIQNAGIDEDVSDVRWLEIKDVGSLDGMSYCIDGKWYYGPEWFIEDAFEIANSDDSR